MDKKFNIRVYGLLIRSNQILVCHENRLGMNMLKFPGGGLQWGEGLMDALIREWFEETSLSLQNPKHFYTTDFFLSSRFNPNEQLISIYYTVDCQEIDKILNQDLEINDGKIRFEWHEINEHLSTILTFPVDQHVSKLLCDL